MRDVLVIGFRGFASEGFDNRCGSRFLSDAVRHGWRRIVGYDFAGGPHYLLRFTTERTTTINTAAIGGNTSLLVMRDEDETDTS